MNMPKIIKNILTVSSGVAFGQALSFLAMPVLSRLYTAESFGVFGTFLSIASILASLATLQYGVALMLPKRDSEAANVFLLGCLSVVTITVLLSGFLALFPDFSISLLKASGDTYLFLLLLPLYVFFNGANRMLIGWSVRRKQYKQNAISQVVRSVTVNGVQIAAAPLYATGGMLTTGAVLGEVGSCINLGYAFWKNETRFFKRCFSTTWMKNLAKAYYDFPAYSAPQNLLNAISQGLPVLLLGHYFGVAAAGFYAFGIRLVQAPMGLLLTPLRQVLFQRFCEVQNRGTSVSPIYQKSTLGLFAIIVLPLLAGITFFPDVFAWIFGEDWRQAGEFARWVLVWQAALFCNLPSVLMARVLRMQRQMLLFDITTLILRTCVLVLGGIYLRDGQTVAAFGVLGAALNLLLIFWIWKKVKHEELSAQND
jgi:O-antigen/teichoic acid export membrane protein